MAKRRSVHKQGASYTYLRVFVLCVVLLVIISLIFKTIAVVRNSKFDGQDRFTIAFCCSDNKAQVVSLSPDDHSGSLLFVDNTNQFTGKEIEIPIDVLVKTSKINFSTHSISSLIFHQVIENGKVPLSMYDKIRIFLFAQSLKDSDINVDQLELPSSDSTIDNKALLLFKDNRVNLENKSIQIINASDVPGVANRLARLITNMGGNVVSVITADQPSNQSSIVYNGSMSYTTQKLEKILNYPLKNAIGQEISDIIITIGKENSFTNF